LRGRRKEQTTAINGKTEFQGEAMTRMQSGPIPFLAGMLMTFTVLAQTDAPDRDAQIRADVEQMADDFLSVRQLPAFPHELSLVEAYHWQDEMIGILRPTFGGVVGYKTGGHNVGPVNPAFPPGGIRGYLLEGMFRPDGASVRVDETSAGFLEADFAFRVGNASINDAETDLEILAGLDAILPFAEVPDPDYAPDDNAMVRGVIANMASRLSFMGEPVAIEPTQEWLQRINTLEFAVMDENDTVIQSGRMEGWYQPIKVVRWLRDQLKESGKALEPGQILSLGSLGINRALLEGTPRGPAYTSNQYRVEYYGLGGDRPATVTINIER